MEWETYAHFLNTQVLVVNLSQSYSTKAYIETVGSNQEFNSK